MQIRLGRYGALIATKSNCSITSKGVTRPIVARNNSAYYIPFLLTGAALCSDGTSIPSFALDLIFNVKYTEHYIHELPQELHDYTVDDWTDYKGLKKLQTGLAKQLIARYTTFSRENYHWIWPVFAITLAILYCATTAAMIYCWCKMVCKIKRTSVRTFEHVVKYVLTNTEEQIPSTSSNLRAKEIEKIYPQLPGPTSIL